MFRRSRPDEGRDEMELDLDQDFAIARFISEAGCGNRACELEEQQKDRERLRSVGSFPD